MKVTEVAPAYYHVAHKGRWWTASQHTQGWKIQNESGQRLHSHGPLGVRILAAIARHQEAA